MPHGLRTERYALPAMKLGNYELNHQLYESSLSRVHRGLRDDGLEVIVKTPATNVSAREFDTRARHELMVCRMCDSPNVISALELVEDGAAAGLVFESIPGAMTLRERGRERPLSLAEALTVALGLLDALTNLHARNIVHKDLKPENILVTPELARVVLIDMGIAAIVPRDASLVSAATKLEGTLHFMPPEQTGRVNRAIDYRSDYYALGATLYWMLIGEAPFAALRDPQQLVHAHIALAPPLLHERDPSIPPALAKLVAKLLSKAADDRYQGSHGLRADLERCLALSRGHTSEDPNFELALHDRSEVLALPRNLYGRELERSQLAELYLDLDDGPFVQFLRGPTGIGKTALVDRFRQSLGGEVVFARGKFEVLSQGTPYGAVGEALRGLIEQLSHDPSARREAMTRIYARVGSNVSLLFDVFPELAQLLGLSVEPGVGSDQTPERERVWDTLDGVIDALLLPERDFVLFIDDLQWADDASMRLLARVLAQRERRVLVLAALRDLDGLREGLAARIDALRQRADLELEPLGAQAVHAMVCDTLGDSSEAMELAALIWERTRGVPLYVAQLLHAMYVDGSLTFEPRAGAWRVNLQQAREHELTVDTVEYLALRFERLEGQTQQTLATAACIGPSFDLDTLAAVVGAQLDVEAHLGQAVSAGYVSTFEPRLEHPLDPEARPAAPRYRFAHDHLRQVALARAPQDRAALHLSIARVLGARWHASSETSNPVDLGRLAEHIALGRELSDSDDERVGFAQLCRAAGGRARRAGAHEVAIRQLESAAFLLEGAARSRWQARAQLLEVTFELGESLYLSSEHEAARQAFARARGLVETRAERLTLLLALARLVLARGDAKQALSLALEAVTCFGLRLDLDAPSGERVGRLATLHGRLDELGAEALAAYEALADEELRALVDLLQTVTHSARLGCDSTRVEVLLSLCMELGLEHGFCATTGLCFVQLASIEITQGGDNERARRYAGIGLALVERFPDVKARAEAQMIYGSTLHPWFEPLASSLAPLASAQRQLRGAGMSAAMLLAWRTRILHGFLVGAPLDTVIDDCAEAEAYALDQGREGVVSAGDPLRQALAVAAATLADEQAREGALEPDEAEAGDVEGRGALAAPVAGFLGLTLRGFANVLLGWRDQATLAIAAAESLGVYATTPLAKLLFEFTAALDACERYVDASELGQTRLVARIDAAMTALARWQASCPANAAPYVHVLAGAWAYARGQREEAVEAYTRAADAAQTSGVCSLEGYANERAANILLAEGKRRAAVGYFDDAYHAYGRWGALALQRRIDDALRRGRGQGTSIATLESVTMDALDLSGVLELAQDLFDAGTLEEVIDRLLHAANETAGATRCLLLLDEHSKLRIRAERRATGELYLLDHGVSLAGAGELLALSVVRACATARATVIVDDAGRDPRYAVDPYILGHGMRALLAVPLLRQSQRVGVLYLENNMTPGAFTPGHVALLSTLATQAAISIDNARLLDALRMRDEQWRAVASNAPDIIIIINRRHCVEYMNRSAYGISPDLLLGEPATVMVTQSDRAIVERAIKHVFETGQASACEARIQTPDASGVRHWAIRVGPIMRGDVVERVTLISTDKTDQLQLEQQLQHSQKLQAVGTLAGGVAHDFNNLLTVIMGASEITGLHSREPMVVDMLGEIDMAAKQAASLTQQLLAFSRKQVLQPRCFDLRELITDVSKLFRRVLGEPIELEMALGDRACMILADPGQISQVLVNLAVNARDAMLDGGTLTIRTEAHDEAGEVNEAEPATEVVLQVSDTGHGMESEVLERIFEPFFTTKGEGKGTGLGMATVLGIVAQSEGSIEVSSAPGEGTTFCITLPFVEGEVEREAGPADSLPRGDEVLLLVEDELAVQRVAMHMLELQGYQVHAAGNGAQAVARALELDKLDLLITDVVMPGKSGSEVADEVTRIWPNARVLYTSGYTDDAVMRHGVLDGTKAYLPKPFARERLARAVRRVLDRAD